MTISTSKRVLLKVAGTTALSALLPQFAFAQGKEVQATPFGAGKVSVLSDGHLTLPQGSPVDSDEKTLEAKTLFAEAGVEWGVNKPPLNITVWQTEDRLVLFDLGSGTQFMDSAGLLPSQLEAMGIDPLMVTDVVFTHAHPDHCWGVLDDFDDLLCPDATYHMCGIEYDYWMSEKTLSNTPESRLAFVAGARNRLPLIEPQLKRFNWGDEIIPGIEAIDSHGHTAGHTSFAIHQASESLLVLGDALTHSVLSFQRPQWERPNDQNPAEAVQTRKRLLDRMLNDKARFIGYHLPTPGLGRVEKLDSNYRYLPAEL